MSDLNLEKLIANQYGKVIDKYLFTDKGLRNKFFRKRKKDIGIMFLPSSEKYADEITVVDEEITASKENNFNIFTYYQYDLRQENTTDTLLGVINFCKIDGYPFLKIVTPLISSYSYDVVVARKENIFKIKNAFDSKQTEITKKNINIPIIGIEENMKILKENSIDFLLNDDFRDFCKSRNIPLKRGIILEGIPGVGKTLSLTWLKYQAEMNDIAFHKFGSAKEFMQNQDRYYYNKKSIFVFEDFDSYVQERKKEKDNQYNQYIQDNPVLSTLLNTLDGTEEISECISIFTTNHIQTFDKAFLRPGRIDKVITYHPPTKEQAKSFFNEYIKDYNQIIVDMVDHIFSKMSIVSYSTLKGIANNINIFEYNTKAKMTYEEIVEEIDCILSHMNNNKEVKDVDKYVI